MDLPREFGRYTLEARVGEGGMGIVFRAFDRTLRRIVAIKLPQPRHSGKARQRFVNEAQKQAAVDHPNVAVIYDAGEIDGQAHIAMEYFQGDTLRADIKHRGMPLGAAMQRLLPIARALSHTHGRQIVHCDLKPENVMRDDSGVVKVMDFGLASSYAPTPQHMNADVPASLSVPLVSASTTGWGLGAGTPRYMSPEQLAGEVPDARSDIYAFGLIAHELLTGDLPGTSRAKPAGPEWLRCCLNHEPAARHSNGAALLSALDRFQRSRQAYRRALIAACVVVAGIVSVAFGGGRWATPDRLSQGMAQSARLLPAPAEQEILETPSSRGILKPLTQFQDTTLGFSRLSPSGRYLIYTEGRRSMLLEVGTGGERRLIPTNPGDHRLLDAVECAAWYPDERSLVASWGGKLHNLDIATGDSTALGVSKRGCPYASPDGQLIALTLRDGSDPSTMNSVAIYDPRASSSLREVVRFQNAVPAVITWSPDSQWLALYAEEFGGRFIAVNVKSGLRQVLLEAKNARNRRGGVGFAWLPTWEFAYYSNGGREALSRPQGSAGFGLEGIWSVDLQPSTLEAGERRLIIPLSANALSLSVDSTGQRLAFDLEEGRDTVLIGDIASPGGLVSGMAPLVQNRPSEVGIAFRSGDELIVASRGAEQARYQYFFRSLITGAMTPWLSPRADRVELFDNDRAIYRRTAAQNEVELFAVDIAAKTESLLQTFSDSADAIPLCGRRSQICLWIQRRDSQSIVHRLSVETGTRAPAFQVEVGRYDDLALSPDGSLLAVGERTGHGSATTELDGRIRFMNLRGALVKAVILPPGWRSQGVAFSSDGSGVWVTGMSESPPAYDLLWVGLDGLVKTVVSRDQGWLHRPVVSPDGKRLAVTVRSFKSNVWLMDR